VPNATLNKNLFFHIINKIVFKSYFTFITIHSHYFYIRYTNHVWHVGVGTMKNYKTKNIVRILKIL
jgi:hypothetical protein